MNLELESILELAFFIFQKLTIPIHIAQKRHHLHHRCQPGSWGVRREILYVIEVGMGKLTRANESQWLLNHLFILRFKQDSKIAWSNKPGSSVQSRPCSRCVAVQVVSRDPDPYRLPHVRITKHWQGHIQLDPPDVHRGRSHVSVMVRHMSQRIECSAWQIS